MDEFEVSGEKRRTDTGAVVGSDSQIIRATDETAARELFMQQHQTGTPYKQVSYWVVTQVKKTR